MSTSRAWPKLAAVLAGAALLGVSAFGVRGIALLPTPATAQNVAAVNRAEAILHSGRSPIMGMALCSPVAGLVPDRFDAGQTVRGMDAFSDVDVIVCFRGGLDYDQVQKIALGRRLNWIRGLGGDKVVVFARDEASFRATARANGLSVGPADLTSVALEGLRPHPERTAQAGPAWRIKADPKADEALYGPYLTVGPGAYSLKTVFEPASPGADCQALETGLMASVQVTADGRSQDLTPPQALSLHRQGPSGCRLQGEADFVVPPGPDRVIETPFWVASPSDVLMTDYEIDAKPPAP